MAQDDIDAALQAYYSELFDEDARLTTRSAQGRLERERTQQIVRAATPAPARILDLGGATGVHAAALARDGYDVVLVDPVASQVARAGAHGTFAAVVGDARRLDLAHDSFDAVLMAGPLYHLAERADRVQALTEARRVCRPGGVVHAAAIPRVTAFLSAAFEPALLEAAPEAWLDVLRRGTPVPTVRFPGGHFHTAEELADEMTEAGLTEVVVAGLEGPAGILLEMVREADELDHDAASRLARSFAFAGSVRELSPHLLGSGTA